MSPQRVRARRGEGVKRVFDHLQTDLDPDSLPWLHRTVLAVMQLPQFKGATIEDIRHMLRSRGHADPPSSQLWGHLARMLVRRNIILETGWRFPNRHPTARGRRTKVYDKES